MNGNLQYYFNPLHGLELNARPQRNFEETDFRDNENGILFWCEYFFLRKIINGGDENLEMLTYPLFRKLTVPGSSGGIYNRGFGKLAYHEVTGELVDISHDNITAIACLSYLAPNDTEFNAIMIRAKKYQYRFDNLNPEKPRWTRMLHPRDIIFLSYLQKNWWAYGFLPLLTLMAVFSCATKWVVRPTWYQKIWNYFFKTGLSNPYRDIATSGKCLWFVRLYTVRDRLWGKITFWLCEKAMMCFTDMNFMEAIILYFKQRTPDKNHPIILSAEYVNKHHAKYY